MRLDDSTVPPAFVDERRGLRWEFPERVAVVHAKRIGSDHPDHPAFHTTDVDGPMPDFMLVEVSDSRRLRSLGAPRWVRRGVTRLRPGVLLVLEPLGDDRPRHGLQADPSPLQPTDQSARPPVRKVLHWREQAVLAASGVIVTRHGVYGTAPPLLMVLGGLFLFFAPAMALSDRDWTSTLLAGASALMGAWLLGRGWWKINADGFTVRSCLWRWWQVRFPRITRLILTPGFKVGAWLRVDGPARDVRTNGDCLGLSFSLGIARQLRVLAVAAEQGWLSTDVRIVTELTPMLPTAKRQRARLEAVGIRFDVRA